MVRNRFKKGTLGDGNDQAASSQPPQQQPQPQLTGGKKRVIETFSSSSRPKPAHRHSRGSSNRVSDLQIKLLYGVIICVVSVVIYFVYLGYLETRIITPFNEAKVTVDTGLDIPNRFWGSYRPGVYFGLKHRSSHSLLAGLMWMIPSQIRPGHVGLRHTCSQDDNLARYGWIEHDGVNFGVQEILDHQMMLTTSFVKRAGGQHGGDWTARISVEPKDVRINSTDDEILLFFYIAKEKGMSASFSPEIVGGELYAIHGVAEELDNFIIRFQSGKGVLHTSYMATTVPSMNDLSNSILNNLVSQKSGGKRLLFLDPREEENLSHINEANFIVYQVHAKGPFTLEVIYETESYYSRPGSLSGDAYDRELEGHRVDFHEKFQKIFHLEPEYNSSSVGFAEGALSNLIGGIGYFHGKSKVQSVYNTIPLTYWGTSLYSGVPSRSFFPRGFLWDEGFMLLVVNKWDPSISIDIISHWLDLMNIEGWIPREQILGEEALSRVPEEFVVQKNDVANPPTLFMALLDLMQRHRGWLVENHRPTLQRMWPRLTAWYSWLNRTQIGSLPSTYRWRGRNETTTRELNPKTLASGLDDYPRASHPSEDERHLDLRCWMGLASKAMADIAILLNMNSEKYVETLRILSDTEQLDSLHWSDELKAYADYGLHSKRVSFKDTLIRSASNPSQAHRIQVRVPLDPPKLGFINTFGYVNLFPMLTQLLPPNSSKLKLILSHLGDKSLLWSPYGLRSISSNSPFYNVRNTEHDPPYWRGPIWININFLALKSLHYYSKIASGEIKALALGEYKELRANLVGNMMREYWRTGYIWEQYDDANGRGKGCRPFTGWSSLIVLIMAEEY